ncbi:MAG: geranylgeranyl diphosphate synthase [Sulfolobaceae archaeon]|nr:geranylgeranyl diphosphate synthase [Sulfolobaceae archaeon]
MSDIDDYIKEITDNVNTLMEGEIKGEVRELYEASKHLIRTGGKRLRPTILVASLDLVGGERKRGYYGGAAVEVLHTFTLIHDDIMDQDSFRRGVPTVHVKYGVPMAILAGDLLHAEAFRLLNMAARGLDSERMYKIFDMFSNAIVMISEGQAMDMSFENRWDITVQEYLEMIEKKTAYLFAASAGLGALIGNANEEEVNNLFNYGINLGISFQIVDDILGLTADEKTLGKPVFSDIREGKKTILVLKALDEAPEEEKKIIKENLGNRNLSREELSQTADIIKKYSLDYSYKLAEDYMNKALDYLNKINVRNELAKKVLEYLAVFTVKRRY